MVDKVKVDRPKADNDDEIDPSLKEKKPGGSSTQPVSPAGDQRRENETDANRDSDGLRKRAEEGL